MDNLFVLFVAPSLEREHLGIMQVAAGLRRSGIPVALAMADITVLDKHLRTLTPRYLYTILGYSMTTALANPTLRLNSRLKKQHRFLSLFGGPHPTFFPEMIQEEGVDMICRGEGEAATEELVMALKTNKPITNIKNLWVKENNTVFKNELRAPVSNLDNLPFPDRSLFRDHARWANTHNMHVITARGCSFACSYCFNHAYRQLYQGHKIEQRRSTPNILNELKNCCTRHDIRFISFLDSIFTSDKQWLFEFLPQFSKEISLPFYCNTHPFCMDEKTAALLARCGCSAVGLGIECGDETVRRNILARPVSNDLLYKTTALIKKYRMKLATGNMLGIPGADILADLATLKFNIQCQADYAIAYILSLHPGTSIYEQAKRRNEIGTEASYYNGIHWTQMKKFSSPQERRMTLNLQNIFGVIVRFPFLYPLTGLLIRLPLTWAYRWAGIFYEALTTFTYQRNRRDCGRRFLVHAITIFRRFKFNAYTHHHG